MSLTLSFDGKMPVIQMNMSIHLQTIALLISTTKVIIFQQIPVLI